MPYFTSLSGCMYYHWSREALAVVWTVCSTLAVWLQNVGATSPREINQTRSRDMVLRNSLSMHSIPYFAMILSSSSRVPLAHGVFGLTPYNPSHSPTSSIYHHLNVRPTLHLTHYRHAYGLYSAVRHCVVSYSYLCIHTSISSHPKIYFAESTSFFHSGLSMQ